MPKLLRQLAVMLGLLAVLSPMEPAFAQTDLPPERREAIEEVVRQYLLDHPEVVIEAIEAYQHQRELAMAEAQRRILTERQAELTGRGAGPIAGNPSGDVTLVEFFDYQCGYCKSVHPSMKTLLRSDPGLRIVFKEFPILGPASVTAAKAALAARRQDRYIEMHDALMELRGPLDDAKVLRVADALDLDVEKLKADMEAPEIQAEIQRNLDLAMALGINGTPAFVVGDEIVPGAVPLDQLEGLVARERAE